MPVSWVGECSDRRRRRHAAALIAAVLARDGRERAVVERDIEARMAGYKRTDPDRRTAAATLKGSRDGRRD